MSALAKLQRVAETMQMVSDDISREATELDGQPFDGRTVSIRFGELMAEVRAVAIALKITAGIVAEGLAAEPEAEPEKASPA